jgi:hypothetical protein
MLQHMMDSSTKGFCSHCLKKLAMTMLSFFVKDNNYNLVEEKILQKIKYT